MQRYSSRNISCLRWKCLSVHKWVEKFSEGSSEVTDYARPGAEVAEISVKSFSMLVEDMSRNIFFPDYNIIFLTFYIHL
jgi:hypothetical protein